MAGEEPWTEKTSCVSRPTSKISEVPEVESCHLLRPFVIPKCLWWLFIVWLRFLMDIFLLLFSSSECMVFFFIHYWVYCIWLYLYYLCLPTTQLPVQPVSSGRIIGTCLASKALKIVLNYSHSSNRKSFIYIYAHTSVCVSNI